MNYFARRRPDRLDIFPRSETRRIRTTAPSPARIDHVVLHGAFYMHISLPFPSGKGLVSALGYAAHVELTIPRSKSSFALLGAPQRAPGSRTVFILYPLFLRHPRPSYSAGYVLHCKAESNYIRDTRIPPRACSAGQLKNNRSSTGQAVLTQLLLSFFPLFFFFSSPRIPFSDGIPCGN